MWLIATTARIDEKTYPGFIGWLEDGNRESVAAIIVDRNVLTVAEKVWHLQQFWQNGGYTYTDLDLSENWEVLQIYFIDGR